MECSLLGNCPDQLKPTRWKKGQSGNPNGLSKRLSFEKVVAKVLDEKFDDTDQTKREKLARVFVDAMLESNGQMIREYLARAWPAVQKHEVGLPELEPNALEAALDRCRPNGETTLPERTNGGATA